MVLCLTLNPALDCTAAADSVRPGKPLALTPPQYTAGGKGINTSRTLRKLGVPSFNSGFIGGPNGGRFLELFRREGLRGSFVLTDAETRQNWEIFSREDRAFYKFNTPGSPVQEKDYRKLVRTLAWKKFEAALISGSLPPSPDKASLLELIRLIQKNSSFLVVDTISPEILDILEGRPADLFKCNLDEARNILQNREEDTGILLKSLELYGRKTLVTDGANGCYWLENGKPRHAFIPDEQRPVTETGAGDAFNAGWIAAYLEKKPMEDCVRMGCACGTAQVYGDPENIDRLKSRIKTD